VNHIFNFFYALFEISKLLDAKLLDDPLIERVFLDGVICLILCSCDPDQCLAQVWKLIVIAVLTLSVVVLLCFFSLELLQTSQSNQTTFDDPLDYLIDGSVGRSANHDLLSCVCQPCTHNHRNDADDGVGFTGSGLQNNNQIKLKQLTGP
jgi:hypothetical protein